MARDRMRKRPQQARSEATVEAIVEATGQVLGSHGREHTTTNRIAERAGVSIGTLYQYFPGKESLIAAFVKHRIEADQAVLEALMRDGVDRPPRDVLVTTSRAFVAMMRDNRALYCDMVELMPFVGYLDELRSSMTALAEFAARYLASRPEVNSDADLHTAALLSIHAVRAALLAAVFDAPDALDDPQLPERLAACAIAFLPMRAS
jgi:AcrR family transcriptional regulator